MALKRMVDVCISLHMELLGPDIQYIQASLPNYGYLALPTVKRILRDVLLAIAYAHSRGIAHTGSLLGLLVPVLCSFLFRGLLDNRPNNTVSLSDAQHHGGCHELAGSQPRALISPAVA